MKAIAPSALLLCTLLATATSLAEPVPPELPEEFLEAPSKRNSSSLLEVLDRARQQLLRTLTPQRARSLGFDGIPGAQDLRVVEGMDEFLIRVESIRHFNGTNPRSLLRHHRRKLFPIVVGNRVHCAFTVAEIRGRWTVVTTGSPTLTRLLLSAMLSARRELQPTLPNARYGIARVSGMNQFFVLVESGARLLLVPVVRNQNLGFKPGVPLEAENVLLKLKPAALRFRGGAPT